MPRRKLLGLFVGKLGRGVKEKRQVLGQLPEQQRLMHGRGARCEDTDRAIPDLPPVAVRTVQHVALPDPRNVRQLVYEPRGDQQPPRADPPAVLQHNDKAAVD